MDVVSEFLKRGILLSPELRDKIKPEEIEKIASRFDKKKVVLTPEEYKLLKGEVKILMEYKKGPEVKRISNFIDFYNRRFEFLRNLLREKLPDATSINKLNAGNVTSIGMVRELTSEGFLLEDQTGSVLCISHEKVLEDDVVGVKGIYKGGKLHVEKIIYPDIPLQREIGLTEDECYVYFTCNFVKKPERALHVFAFNVSQPPNDCWLVTKKTGLPKSQRKVYVNLPSLVEVNGVKIFMFESDFSDLKRKLGEDDEKKLILSLLRRRHLLPNVYMEGDPYLLREIPDIIFLRGNEDFFLNYKGVSVISVSGDRGFLVNLKTREYEYEGDNL